MTIQQIYLGNMGDYFLQSVSLERDCSAVQTDRKRNAFFFNDTAPTEFYTLSLHDALPISRLTLMSLIKMMLVMVSVAAISKTFGLLRFLLRLSFLAK